MNITGLLDELNEIIDSAWSLPLSGGKTVIDAERFRELVEEIRINLPQEIRQAKAIVADRTSIISDAKKESESIVRSSAEKAKTMISKDEIVKLSQGKANEIIISAQNKAKEIRKAANEYVEDLIKKTEEQISQNLL